MAVKKTDQHRTTIIFRPEVLVDIDARAHWGRGQTVNRDLARIYELYALELRVEIGDTITPSEGALILDVMNGVLYERASHASILWAEVADACKLDRTDEKWEVDGQALVEKLRAMSRIQCLALIDMAERFWHGVGTGGPEATVAPREWVAGELGIREGKE